MKCLRPKPLAVSLLLSLLPFSVSAATYTVSSIAELNSRIASAVAGDTIIVENGVYTTTSSIGVSRVGTANNPILIRAETVGGVEITGSHGFSLNSGAAHVHIQGFKFTHTSGRNAINNGATFCRFTRNVFECTGGGNYLVVSGHDSRIDRNEFRNKSTVGNMIDVRGSGSQIARRVWIHHNYFHDFTNAGENGAETIRFGLSGLSLSTGNGLIEHNLFVRCRGENEMISNKSSGNTYRYNTVLESAGAEISQRHGNDNLFYGNYMRNTAGMRVYGDRNIIFNNHLESNSIGVNMGNGDGDVYNGAALTAHDRPDDNVVVFNIFVNNNTHYQMGGRTGGLGSSNTVVANNIFQGGGSIGSISSSAPYTGSWSNNIRWQTSSAGNMPASGYINVNPLLVKDASGAYHIQPGSPAINAGVAAYNYYGVLQSFSYVTADMDGQPRDSNKDIGADEFSAAPPIAKILTTNDVGPNSFEGAIQFQLEVNPSSRTLLPGSDVTYTATVTTLNGTTGVVSLAATSLPPGVEADFDPPQVTNSGNAILTLSASNSTPFGTYTLNVIGTSSNLMQSVPVDVTIGDFSVSATPSFLSVMPGSNTHYIVTIETNDAFSGSVTFDVSGLPAGVNASFDPASLDAAGSSVLTVATADTVVENIYGVTISATGGTSGGTATAVVSLNVSSDTEVQPGALVARLTFDDNTGNDSSGRDNHGTLLNGASIVDDIDRGKVLLLDGTDDYVDLGNAPSLDLSDNGQATITAWVKMGGGKNHNSIVTKGEWQDAYSLLIKGDTAPPSQLWTGNNISVFSGNPIPTNVWTHVAVIINGDLTTFYINGQVSGVANQDRGEPIDNNPLDRTEIGREDRSDDGSSGRWYFFGRLDDVRIYEAALSLADIQAIMAVPVNGAPSFSGNPLSKPAIVAGQPYSDSISGDATDPNAGDELTFSKMSGPDWLSVDSDGVLSGTPLSDEVGMNSFVVRVTDSGHLFDDTTLNIMVNPAPPIYSTMTWQGGELLLSWTGGIPPYHVHMSTNAEAAAWQDFAGMISSNSLTIAPTNATEFYRIEGQ